MVQIGLFSGQPEIRKGRKTYCLRCACRAHTGPCRELSGLHRPPADVDRDRAKRASVRDRDDVR